MIKATPCDYFPIKMIEDYKARGEGTPRAKHKGQLVAPIEHLGAHAGRAVDYLKGERAAAKMRTMPQEMRKTHGIDMRLDFDSPEELDRQIPRFELDMTLQKFLARDIRRGGWVKVEILGKAYDFLPAQLEHGAKKGSIALGILRGSQKNHVAAMRLRSVQ